MKTYWDTSAVINAAVSPAVMKLLDVGEHFTRAHTFSEFFGTMTGRGIKSVDADGNLVTHRFGADDTHTWLSEFAKKITFIDLGGQETLDWIGKARSKNVEGPKIHDLLHVAAAEKSQVERILTRNLPHFQALSTIPSEKP
jgi:hypothetical protein